MKSKPTGYGLISTVFCRTVLLCVSLMIIIIIITTTTIIIIIMITIIAIKETKK